MCDSLSPLCALSGTVSKLQAIPGFAMSSDRRNPHPEIRHFQGLSAGVVTVSAKVCVWRHISHHGETTKMKNGVNQVFKDFFNGRGHCTETGGDN